MTDDPIRPDPPQASGEIAGAFLSELERWLATNVSGSATDLRTALLARLRAAQAEHAPRALVHQLCARALDVAQTSADRGETAAAARGNLERSCAAEREDLAASFAAIARTACALLDGRSPWIATLSRSGAVREALLLARQLGRTPRALVAESRPLREGREMAAALAQAGIPAWLVVDAALPLLLAQAQAVWLGADAVTDRGILNKIGSFALALAAREHSVPVYALATRRKFLPASTRALIIPEMPPAEVWDGPAPGVQPRNVYFELVPLELVRGVVVEDEVLGPGEAAQLARERELPEPLRGA